MTLETPKQKLFCYVDETGQDDRAECFIVVAVVSASEQSARKESLLRLERQTKIGGKKWHKLRAPEREHFLERVIHAQLAAGEVFFGRYQKPVPYFQPMVETLAKAILHLATEAHQMVVYVDGIDRKKARELTLALRAQGIKTQQVRSARDESEPLIRLADRWAGCVRASVEGQTAAADLVRRALASGYWMAT